MNRPINEDKCCFTFCGEDRCDCGAATGFIVANCTAGFRAELARILADEGGRTDRKPGAPDTPKAFHQKLQ